MDALPPAEPLVRGDHRITWFWLVWVVVLFASVAGCTAAVWPR